VPGPEAWLSRAGSQCVRCWERWLSPVRRRVAAHVRSMRCETAVAILAPEGLAQPYVTHLRVEFTPHLFFFFFLFLFLRAHVRSMRGETAGGIRAPGGLAHPYVTHLRVKFTPHLFFFFLWLSYFFLLFFSRIFLIFLLFLFSFFCVCACVCVSRVYVRAYLAIPCVSADDNVKHKKSNIRYDNKLNQIKQMLGSTWIHSAPSLRWQVCSA